MSALETQGPVDATAPPAWTSLADALCAVAQHHGHPIEKRALLAGLPVTDDIASGRLARALPAELPVEAGFHIVFPRKPRHPGPVEAVCRWLVEAAAGNRPARLDRAPGLQPDTRNGYPRARETNLRSAGRIAALLAAHLHYPFATP